MNTEIYRLVSIENQKKPAPAVGLVDKIVADIKDAMRSKLIVVSGVAGSGKNIVSDAVAKALHKEGVLHDDNFRHIDALTNGAERPNALEQSIEYSQKHLNFEAINDDSVGVVIWDEVRYSDSELAEIERLLQQGYIVIALDQNHDKLKTFDHQHFDTLSEYRLA